MLTQSVSRYWDETRDAGKFSKSPVFDTVLGFGGSGKGAQNCVTDGPFANLTVNIGPGFKSEPRCLNRRITDFLSSGTAQSNYNTAISGAKYAQALDAIYSGPHLTGHMALSMMVRLSSDAKFLADADTGELGRTETASLPAVTPSSFSTMATSTKCGGIGNPRTRPYVSRRSAA